VEEIVRLSYRKSVTFDLSYYVHRCTLCESPFLYFQLILEAVPVKDGSRGLAQFHNRFWLRSYLGKGDLALYRLVE
jgi:hypothetical protein